jgi:integrase
VYLIPPARKAFEDWVARVGVRPLEEPIFQTERGCVNGDHLTRLLKQAMKGAGIPLVGRDGRPRKPFHALRATFARVCLESGRPPQWVQGQLGHSSESSAMGVYGEWAEDAIAAEASRAVEFPDI